MIRFQRAAQQSSQTFVLKDRRTALIEHEDTAGNAFEIAAQTGLAPSKGLLRFGKSAKFLPCAGKLDLRAQQRGVIFRWRNSYRLCYRCCHQNRLRCSGRGVHTGLVEFIELADGHPFFVATQAHPEFTSRPDHPHPLFAGLLRAAQARALHH